MPETVRSPKLSGRSDWYQYYAGYSRGFVEDAVVALELPANTRVLDPWNGSGTTTAVTDSLNLRGHGFDINPASVVVARGRLLPTNVSPSLSPLATDLLSHARGARKRCSVADDDLLRCWFDQQSAVAIKAIGTAIRENLTDAAPNAGGAELASQVSTLAAFYYVALFGVVRDLTSRFRTTNPTWVRTAPTASESLVQVGWPEVSRLFREQVAMLQTRLNHVNGEGRSTVRVAESSKLPLRARSVGGVISSPPYCTRIDYVIATLPELAVLGFSAEEVRTLRGLMVGTPTMTMVGAPVADPKWGKTAVAFTHSVFQHRSKASKGYYSRYFAQYFDGLLGSIIEIDRVASPSARMAFVVQDSYYKEKRLDLAAVVAEMLRVVRPTMSTWHTDFKVRTRASVNPRARKYRTEFSAKESIVWARPG